MSAIASIQYGTISVGAGATSATATITSVSTTTSNVILLGLSSDDTGVYSIVKDFARVDLTNATTVTATRNLAGPSLTVSFVVVTWGTGTTTNVQQGTITIANSTASNTATITSVDTTKSVLFWLGEVPVDTGIGRSDIARLALTNATTVTATRGSGADAVSIVVGYVVVSFA